MRLELDIFELSNLVEKQVKNLLNSEVLVYPYMEECLIRVEECFRKSANKYYRNSSNEIVFNPFHSGQYSIFLYYLANTIKKREGSVSICDKIYYLNKILNSVDWYHGIELPNYWGVEHPLASVLGNAKYQEGFFIYQGCTVGGNKGLYPSLGKNVIMFSNSSILGNCKIGNNVLISTGTTIKDENIPDNCVVYGQSPNLIIKYKNAEQMLSEINKIWKIN